MYGKFLFHDLSRYKLLNNATLGTKYLKSFNTLFKLIVRWNIIESYTYICIYICISIVPRVKHLF